MRVSLAVHVHIHSDSPQTATTVAPRARADVKRVRNGPCAAGVVGELACTAVGRLRNACSKRGRATHAPIVTTVGSNKPS